MSAKSPETGSPAAGLVALLVLLVGAALLIGLSGGPPATPRVKRDSTVAQVDQHQAPEAPPPPAPKTGRELYLHHCAACHGENGDGHGVAAKFLFPKPRDFHQGKFRLVSTGNRVPSDTDLDAVLVRGMPGSAMPPWSHLSVETRKLLIEEIKRLTRDGAREFYTKTLKDQDGLTDEEIKADPDLQQEIEGFATRRITPGAASAVPDIGAPDEAAIARGKEIYIKQSCHSCHGKEGKGDGVQKMIDDEGYPTRPRDFLAGVFKGGHDPASLYRRVAYGMPGTPMPSSGQLTPDQTIDLVHFIRSLSSETARQRAVLNRDRIVAKKVDSLPAGADDSQWASAEPVSVRTTPLWWRDGADPDLRVQACYDKDRIALRLSWSDATANRDAARSETFEDAVAAELYQGNAEPFVGMGGPNWPVDVWFWDADRQDKPLAVEDVYPNAVADVYPFSEKVVDTAESNRPGALSANQPDISLPARAAGNPIVPSGGESGATSLAAGGPGSVTFRMPKNQLVQARGQWQDGRWTVVMTRPLRVSRRSDGVSLGTGERASIAFAIWDGGQQDRDGKKLISIWQDLVLEGGTSEATPTPETNAVADHKPTPPQTPQPKPRLEKPQPKPEPKPRETTKPRVAAPVPSGSWGTLRGRFVFDGTPPDPKKLTPTKDQQFCGMHELYDESLVVNRENGGLANVVVYLYLKRGEKAPPVHPSCADAAKSTVTLDNDKCRFEPHVCLVRTGQTLLVGNKDTVGHNTKVDARDNASINPILPAGGSLEHRFQREERSPATASCSIHPWMNAWIVVRDNPYFAVTDKNGEFTIENLPAGDWTFRVWHERGRISQVTRDGTLESWQRGRFQFTIAPGGNDLKEIRVPAETFQ